MATSLALAPLFAARADAHPGHALAVSGERQWSYGEVQAQATALAAALADLGVEAGDRVAINLPNGIEWIVATVAADRRPG